MGKIKVLFVDDEILAMEYLKNMIPWEELGYEIVGLVRSGKKAFEIYEKEHPQIVISDIKMPGMDGLELSRELKKRNKDIEIILLSAYKDFEYAQKGIEYGVSNYLLKHELCEEKLMQILEKINSSLQNRKHTKRIYQKYFMEQLIFHEDRKQLPNFDEAALGNRFFMLLLHKNESFEKGSFRKDEWSREELKLVEQTAAEEEEDISFISDIQLTGDNILVLYKVEHINSRYQVSRKIEQKSREIAGHLSVFPELQFNIIFSDEISREQISSTFQKLSGYVRYSVFWKSRCIYEMNRLREACEEEQISWNEHEKELRSLIAHEGGECCDYVEYLFELVRFPEHNLRALRELVFMLENLVREFEKKEGVMLLETPNQVTKIDGICTSYILRINAIAESISANRNLQYSRLVCDILDYIQENYKEELTLDTLGEVFSMNGVYLGQMFKKETGVTFLKHLTGVRMEKAKKLLLWGEMNVSQVAEKVGYKTSQYFSQTFIKNVGMKPQEYRKWSGKKKERDN